MTNPRKENDIDYFNHWSGSYEQHIGQFFFFDPVHRGILDRITRMRIGKGPATLLDIGCGTGRLLRKARSCWPEARLIGVDLSSGMVDVARRLTPGVEFIIEAAETLALPDASIDVATSTISFHHWTNQEAGIGNVARMLTRDGIFILADIVLPGPVTSCFRIVNPKGLAGFYEHYRKNSPGTIRRLFTQAGLAVKEQRRLAQGLSC